MQGSKLLNPEDVHDLRTAIRRVEPPSMPFSYPQSVTRSGFCAVSHASAKGQVKFAIWMYTPVPWRMFLREHAVCTRQYLSDDRSNYDRVIYSETGEFTGYVTVEDCL